MNSISGVYKISGPNNKFYIGSSKNIEKRLQQHRYNLNNKIHHCKHLQAAWNKHGEDSFLEEILEECTSESLSILEQKYLDLYWNSGLLYNSNKFSYSAKSNVGQRLNSKFKKQAFLKHNKDTWELLTFYMEKKIPFFDTETKEIFYIEENNIADIFDFLTSCYDYSNLYLEVNKLTPSVVDYFNRNDLNKVDFIYATDRRKNWN